jgi:hypothetical protein
MRCAYELTQLKLIFKLFSKLKRDVNKAGRKRTIAIISCCHATAHAWETSEKSFNCSLYFRSLPRGKENKTHIYEKFMFGRKCSKLMKPSKVFIHHSVE